MRTGMERCQPIGFFVIDQKGRSNAPSSFPSTTPAEAVLKFESILVALLTSPVSRLGPGGDFYAVLPDLTC